MATEFFAIKLYQSLVPSDFDGAEAMEKLKPGGIYKIVVTQIRNYKHHQKFFCLLNAAYKAWEAPELEHKGVKVTKNKQRFRKDMIILCGYYETVVNINGEIRLEAKSISFANMDQVEFDRLYSKAIDVILGNILTHYTREDLDEQVNRILGFC